MVSVEGKDMAMTMSGEVQGDERKRTTDEVSKRGIPIIAIRRWILCENIMF